MEIDVVDAGGGEFRFGPGTYSIGFMNSKIGDIPEGVYRGSPINSNWTTGYWRIHNGYDSDTELVARNSGPFPLYVEITGGRFFTSSGTIWTLIEKL